MCAECGEDFTTEERLTTPLINVKVNGRPFDRGRLKASIARIAVKRLTDAEVDEVTDHAVRRLQAHVSKNDQERVGGGDVIDSTLDAFLDAAKRQRETGYRRDSLLAAHVQYALATKGTQWTDAAAFLQWHRSHDVYNGLTPRTPAYPAGPRAKRYWAVPPTDPLTKIQTVIKNTFVNPTPGDGFNPGDAKDTRHRDREQFDPAKLSKTIGAALRGRKAESETSQLERGVLWALTGQVHVRSSQISTLVSDVLRCLDDIAYLRWVMIGKELDARSVVDEAIGLIRYPSPALEFANDDTRLLWAQQPIAVAGDDRVAIAGQSV